MNRKNHLFFLYLLGSQDQNPVDAVSYFCGSNGFILKQTCHLRNNKIYKDIWSGSATLIGTRNTYVTCDSHVIRTCITAGRPSRILTILAMTRSLWTVPLWPYLSSMSVRTTNAASKYFFAPLSKDRLCLSLGITEILITRCGNVLKLSVTCLASRAGRGRTRRVSRDVRMIPVWWGGYR